MPWGSDNLRQGSRFAREDVQSNFRAQSMVRAMVLL